MKQDSPPLPVTVQVTFTAEQHDSLRLILEAWAARYRYEGQPVPGRVRSLIDAVNGGA